MKRAVMMAAVSNAVTLDTPASEKYDSLHNPSF